MARRKKAIPTETRLVSALRKVWRWSKERRLVKEGARRAADQFQCSVCLKLVDRIEIDHLHDMAGLIKRTGVLAESNWQKYVELLFCSADHLRPVCPPCHRSITAAQRKARKLHNDAITAAKEVMEIQAPVLKKLAKAEKKLKKSRI